MKYVALLRGINVGGNNIIKMLALKETFEKSGFRNVSTYIQSGNVIFESEEKDIKKITKTLEATLTKTFNYNARIIVKSDKQMQQIVENIPLEWNRRSDIRCYIAFLLEPLSEKDAVKEITLKENVDSLKIGPGVLYMTTVLSELTKSKFNKLASTKIYKEITIRNYNTTKKIIAVMGEIA